MKGKVSSEKALGSFDTALWAHTGFFLSAWKLGSFDSHLFSGLYGTCSNTP